MNKKLVSDWGHVNKIGFMRHVISSNRTMALFVYKPKNKARLPQCLYRDGKRNIKIKRFGKTKQYRISKKTVIGWKVNPVPRILNDNWIVNLRSEIK